MDPFDFDRYYMGLALDEARKAAATGEVPVGAVIVRKGGVVSYGHNLRETNKNALAHAEVEAIHKACKALGGWRLPQSTLYVTLEPCAMCAGAIINARIDRVVFGAPDLRFGACGSVVNLFEQPFNHSPSLTGGVRAEEALALMQEFFASLRARRGK